MAALPAWARARAPSSTAFPTPIPTIFSRWRARNSAWCFAPSSPPCSAFSPCGMLLRAANARDPFCQLAGAGLAVVTAVQAFINMGVAVSLLPAKGMTLPFISYGGSSLFSIALTMGFALAVTRQRPKLATRAESLLGALGVQRMKGAHRPFGRRHRRPSLSRPGAGGRTAPARPRHRGDDRRALRQLRHLVSRRADRDGAIRAAEFPAGARSRSPPECCWRWGNCCA